MAEQDAARPTFESFWKEGKQKEKESQVSFVTDTSPPGTKQESASPKDGKETSTDPDAAQDKAKIRRAQVRKAQIQHRQRKADYVGKLEADVANYRELISRAELQSQILARENEAFREKLRQALRAHNEPQAAVPIAANTSRPEPVDLGCSAVLLSSRRSRPVTHAVRGTELGWLD